MRLLSKNSLEIACREGFFAEFPLGPGSLNTENARASQVRIERSGQPSKRYPRSGRRKMRGKWILFLGMLAASLSIVLFPAFASTQLPSQQKPCSEYSDPFDTYNPERWSEVLFLSMARGAISVDNGWLTLTTPKDQPCEIQLYSLFSLSGDFDIQTQYDFSSPPQLPLCRFNAGLVIQTLGDEKSYKCYIAAALKEDFFFRARLDASGEKNLEKYKGRIAPQEGFIRVVRKGGQISFLTLEAGEWRVIHAFSEPCNEKMRVRFKLQTSGEDESMQPCPVTVRFDNFKVNSCDRIVEE